MIASHARVVAGALAAAVAGIAIAAAAESGGQESVQPYIDQLLETSKDDASADVRAPDSERKPDPYIRSLQGKLGRESGDESYIESLRPGLSEDDQKKSEQGPSSYTEGEKSRLGATEKEGGAIEALKEGRSELTAKREGKIRHAVGFTIGASVSRQIVPAPGAGARTFSEIYGDNWVPDLSAFYEFQPFRSEILGNLGLIFSLGFATHKGTGLFQFNLVNARTGQRFPSQSSVIFRFTSVPASAGLVYRFHLLRIVRPYVRAGAMAIGYAESRDDGRDGFRGHSRGLLLSGGINLFLNWFDRRSAWSLYETGGVHHFYLTVDYSRLFTVGGDVAFTISGINAGLTYEF